MAKAKRRSSSSGEETKAKIVEATLQTLQEEGIVGASARAIARAGDFNQALIFYHFGSVDDAIVAAVGELSRRRLERYREPLMAVDNLTELIGVARELYENDRESGEITVLAQAFAGASRDAEMGPAMFDYISDWNVLIEEVVQRAIEASRWAPTPWPERSRAARSRWGSRHCSWASSCWASSTPSGRAPTGCSPASLPWPSWRSRCSRRAWSRRSSPPADPRPTGSPPRTLAP